VPNKAKTRTPADEQRAIIVDHIADILRCGDPTPFAFEAVCRHGLRGGLVMRGRSWPVADEIAAGIVRSALNMIGARRPSWLQGQPEYVQYGVKAFERTRCVECGWRLPEGHTKFCGLRCSRAFHNERYRSDRLAELAAYARAYRAAQRARAA
jgi:hypothetical protein